MLPQSGRPAPTTCVCEKARMWVSLRGGVRNQGCPGDRDCVLVVVAGVVRPGGVDIGLGGLRAEAERAIRVLRGGVVLAHAPGGAARADAGVNMVDRGRRRIQILRKSPLAMPMQHSNAKIVQTEQPRGSRPGRGAAVPQPLSPSPCRSESGHKIARNRLSFDQMVVSWSSRASLMFDNNESAPDSLPRIP